MILHQRAQEALASLFAEHPALQGCRQDIERATMVLVEALERGGRVYVCGNGGSSADSAHITGELVKGFLLRRPLKAELTAKLAAIGEEGVRMAAKLQQGLPAMDLTAQGAVISAIANDLGADYIFAQQLMAYGRPGDVLLALSTSGTAANVNCALRLARALGVGTIALTGSVGEPAVSLADVAVRVPETVTFRVQEYHLPVYHALCAAVEAHFFEE